MTELACPTVEECIAVGGTSYLLRSNDGGANWRVVDFPSSLATPLEDVSCPSPTRCYLVGGEPAGGTGTVVLAAPGADGPWRVVAQVHVPDVTAALACPTTATCIAVGAAGGTESDILSTTDGWAHWSVFHTQAGVSLQAVGCASAQRCSAVGGGAFNVGRSALFTTDAGRSWSGSSVPAAGAPPPAGLTSVECASPPVCVALGGGGAVLISRDSGATWRSAAEPAGWSAGGPVECSEGACLTTASRVTRYGSPAGLPTLLESRDGGASWSISPLVLESPPVVGVGQVACGSASQCVAAALTLPPSSAPSGTQSLPEMLWSDDGGRHWTPSSLPIGPTVLAEIRAVACPSPGHCLAAGWDAATPAGFGPRGSQEAMFRTTDGGRTWARQIAVTPATDRFGFDALGCASASACLAALSDNQSANELLRTTDGGISWEAVTLPDAVTGVFTVVCPSSTRCFAGGEAGTGRSGAMLAVSDDAGASWRVVPRPPAMATIYALACSASARCIAAGPPSAGPDAGPYVVDKTSDGGATWSQARLPAGVRDVLALACAGPECVAPVTTAAAGSGALLVSPDSGSSWRLGGAGPVTNPADVGCAASGLCLVAGTGGLNGMSFMWPTHIAG